MFYGSRYTAKLAEEDLMKKVSDKTVLSKVRDLVGQEYIIKKQISKDRQDINKFRNEFVKSVSIAEELAEVQRAEGFKVDVPEYCSVEQDSFGGYAMILHITDWHIGYIIDNCKGNYYNYAIANERVNTLIDAVNKFCAIYSIKRIYVINTGDMIEHVSMRKNQSQFTEMNQAEQVNAAIKLIFRLLVQISKDRNVEYDSVYGNHDRSNGDKTANLDGDNAETIIREQLENLVTIGEIKNIYVVNRRHTDKEIIKEINGVMIKAKHGEGCIKDDRAQLKADISMDEEFYDILLKGHEHNFRCVSENRGRYIVSTGCVSGWNSYSQNFGCATNASQTIIILGDGEVELIKDVMLQ